MFPFLRPYNSHKLAFRSLKYIFLGYSGNHKGYQCLHIHSGQMYVYRHVVFDELQFPFASSFSTPLRAPTSCSTVMLFLLVIAPCTFSSQPPGADYSITVVAWLTRSSILSVPSLPSSSSHLLICHSAPSDLSPSYISLPHLKKLSSVKTHNCGF